MELNQVTLPCTDITTSIPFYQQLGLTLIVDSRPRYARFECPVGGATFSLHRVPTSAAESGVVVYFELADLDARVEELKAMGIVFQSGPTDERWLWREARLRDPDGNEICLYHAGENRRFPPWRVGPARHGDV